MKKLLSLFVLVLLCVSCFVSCGDEPVEIPSILLSKFENSFNNELFRVSLVFTETADGYTFQYETSESIFYTIAYYGTADQEKNITELSIEFSKVNMDEVADFDTYKKEVTSLSLPHLDAAHGCAYHLISAYEMIGGKAVSNFEEADFLLKIVSDGETVKVGDWTISATVSKENKTIIVHVKSGAI